MYSGSPEIWMPGLGCPSVGLEYDFSRNVIANAENVKLLPVYHYCDLIKVFDQYSEIPEVVNQKPFTVP